MDQKGFQDGASTLRLVGPEDVARTGEDFQACAGEDGSHATRVLDRHEAIEVPMDEESGDGQTGQAIQ